MPDPSPVPPNKGTEARRIFGVPIEGPSLDEALKTVEESQKPIWIVTANPEILLFAKNHPEYAETLNRADVRTVDGFGLWLVMRAKGQPVTRVTGVQLAEALLRQAADKNWRVGLLGGGSSVAQQAADHWRGKFSNNKIQAEEGGRVDGQGVGDPDNDEARYRLTMFDPQVLLVAFGHPKQEQWIKRYLNEFPNLRAVVGVGGTFDFWTGNARRSPRWMQRVGLEWLWRLLVEPKRWKRIWNAVIVFPWKVLTSGT